MSRTAIQARSPVSGSVGSNNIIDRNEAWNCQSGIDLFNQSHLAHGVAIPSVKGGTPDTTPVLQNLVPSSFKNNVTAANTDAGLEYWSVVRFPAESHISANNALKQVWNGQADGPAEIYLVDADSHRVGGRSGGLGLRGVVHRLQHRGRNAARGTPGLSRRGQRRHR